MAKQYLCYVWPSLSESCDEYENNEQLRDNWASGSADYSMQVSERSEYDTYTGMDIIDIGTDTIAFDRL